MGSIEATLWSWFLEIRTFLLLAHQGCSDQDPPEGGMPHAGLWPQSWGA